MKDRNYPIILGHRFRKGILAIRDGTGFNFLICRLKKEYQTGERFDLSDVESIEKEICFCDRETLETTVKVMSQVLKLWGERKRDK